MSAILTLNFNDEMEDVQEVIYGYAQFTTNLCTHLVDKKIETMDVHGCGRIQDKFNLRSLGDEIIIKPKFLKQNISSLPKASAAGS